MKKIGVILLLFGSVNFIQAQNDFLEKKPISISYFGHYYVHPGLKIGTQYNWKSWQKEKERKKKTVVKIKKLFVSPQIGFYVHPLNHSGLLLNADFGYERRTESHKLYYAYSIGFGYMTQFNAGTTYIHKTNGSITAKKWASRSYFMPSLNIEVGRAISQDIAWFTKFSAATKLFYNTGVSGETFFELGLKINLGK